MILSTALTAIVVSIPTGSIKISVRIRQSFSAPWVSIPTGSIKMSAHSGSWTFVSVFQFQLVRLKSDSGTFDFTPSVFQFQLVRLKSIPFHLIPKELFVSIPTGSIKMQWWRTSSNERRVSIPTGSIKIQKGLPSYIVDDCFNSNWFD